MPVVNAEVITEIDAIKILTGADSTHISSGGVGGSEGSVTLVVDGFEPEVKAVFNLLDEIKGEPAVNKD